MKRAITGALTLVGLVLVICSVMGVILLGANGTWHSELKVPAGRTAVVVDPALAAVMGPRISVAAPRSTSPPTQRRAAVRGPRPSGRHERPARDARTGSWCPAWTASRAAGRVPAARQRPVAGPGLGGPLAVPGAPAPGAVEMTYRARPGAESVVHRPGRRQAAAGDDAAARLDPRRSGTGCPPCCCWPASRCWCSPCGCAPPARPGAFRSRGRLPDPTPLQRPARPPLGRPTSTSGRRRATPANGRRR